MNERIEIPIRVSLEEESLRARFEETEPMNASFGEIREIITSDYEQLQNKPSINAVEVRGDKTASDYRLQNKMDALGIQEIEKILYLT